MALTTTRTRLHTHLRRALSLSSFHRLPTTTTTTTTTTTSTKPFLSSHPPQPQYKQLRYFHSTNPSLAYSKTFNDIDKIDPDTILFEGCDYRHWLIVMDFGKDPEQYPPPDQMVDTYVQTCAQVLGSVEEAKKKIYACSTTTYTGFQVEVDEETSKKFDGLPGVLFVLPDSYIDPVNKEYGGDKYINGTIIPRPPPVQYGRNRRNDQRSRGSFSQRRYPADNQQGSMLGEGRGNTPQRDHYQSGGNTSPPPQQRNHNQGPPSHQGNYNQGLPSHQGNYNQGMPSHLGINNHGVPNQQGNYNPGVPTHQGNYNPGVPTHQGNYNYNPGVPTHQGDYNHGVRAHQGNYNQGYTQPHLMENFAGGDRGQDYNRQGDHGYNHSQGQMRNFRDNQGGYTPQRQAEYPGSGRNYAHVPPARGADGQTGVGSFEQNGPGRYGQGPSGTYSEGTSAAYGPGNTSQLGDQRFSQGPGHYGVESTEHHNYSPSDQAGMNQKRF